MNRSIKTLWRCHFVVRKINKPFSKNWSSSTPGHMHRLLIPYLIVVSLKTELEMPLGGGGGGDLTHDELPFQVVARAR